MALGDGTHDLDFHLNYVLRATTDLRNENLRLQAENERLEKLVSEVLPEVKLLREERMALKAAIGALLRQNGIMLPANNQKIATFAMLPYEILQLIFNFAGAELTYQFDPSIQPGAHNPWFQLIRTRKTLPLICRTSFWPGMSVLYSDIVFRRMGQVSALAETLRIADIGRRLGNLIKGIRWDSCVVAASCSDVIREDLTFMFSQCTQLQSFSYHPHPNFPLQSNIPDHDKCEGFFNPLWFVLMPPPLLDLPLLQDSAVSTLRILDMPVDFQANASLLPAVHRILPMFRALESLALGKWPLPPQVCPEELMKLPAVSLPSLVDLRIFAPMGAVSTYTCSCWEAPKLTRLTVLLSSGWSPIPLLEKFGRRLRYLHLYPTRNDITDRLAYVPTLKSCSALSVLCPRLEHLIVPKLLDATSYPLLIDSPTLVHLDLWASATDSAASHRQDGDQAALYRDEAVKPGSSVPSLRTVRFLFTRDEDPRDGLWRDFKSQTRHPDWPWICHPRLLSERSDEVLYHRFAQGSVAQTVAALIPQDLGELTWEGSNLTDGWPAVYDDLEEVLKRTVDEQEEGKRREKEREVLGLETSDSDWSSDTDLEGLGEGEGNARLDEGIRDKQKQWYLIDFPGVEAAQAEDVEGEEEDEEKDKDEDEDEVDADDEEGGNEGSEEEEDDDEGNENENDGEGDGGGEGEGAEEIEESEVPERVEEGGQEQEKHEPQEELTPRQLEAAAELILPEYPIPQLDRETVLTAFRRGRDRGAYNHVNLWDHY